MSLENEETRLQDTHMLSRPPNDRVARCRKSRRTDHYTRTHAHTHNRELKPSGREDQEVQMRGDNSAPRNMQGERVGGRCLKFRRDRSVLENRLKFCKVYIEQRGEANGDQPESLEYYLCHSFFYQSRIISRATNFPYGLTD